MDWWEIYEIAKDFQTLLAAFIAGTAAIIAATIAYRAAGRQARAIMENGRAQIAAGQKDAAERRIARQSAFRRATSLALMRLSDECGKAAAIVADRIGRIAFDASVRAPRVLIPALLENEWEELGALDAEVQNTISTMIFTVETINQEYASSRTWEPFAHKAMMDRLSNISTAAHELAIKLNPSLGGSGHSP